MSMTVWDPLREVESMLDRYTRASGRSLVNGDTKLEFTRWSPTVNIEEDEKRFILITISELLDG